LPVPAAWNRAILPEPAMTFSLATWNINSVRLRLPLVTRFLRSYAPDILCLQEIKCPMTSSPFGRLP
jgi:exonuclease III